jgi:hypothetical protein
MYAWLKSEIVASMDSRGDVHSQLQGRNKYACVDDHVGSH